MKTHRILIVLIVLLSGCRITTLIEGQGVVASPTGTFFCSEAGGDCFQKYTSPTIETLMASPAPGYTFARWSGCNYVSLTSCATPIIQNAITQDLPWNITATFKPINPPVQEAIYTYNALGQRITKTVGAVTTIFQYDLDGTLMAELNASGQPLRQHIHVNGMPIAQISTDPSNSISVVHYIHADHLGTPTLLTDQNKNVVADIEAAPFGETYVDYATVVHNRRFPGQYKDEESGLHYNYYRDYDPSLGRYVQSDPIGLGGGINTYAYASGNPVNRIDIFALSDVVFDRRAGTIKIADKHGVSVKTFPAANNTTSKSRGPWPNGTFDYSHYMRHPESRKDGPFGSNGNFVFDVPGRSGMGIHSGRKGPESKTLGCIRTTDEGTDYLRRLDDIDPIQTLTVQ